MWFMIIRGSRVSVIFSIGLLLVLLFGYFRSLLFFFTFAQSFVFFRYFKERKNEVITYHEGFLMVIFSFVCVYSSTYLRPEEGKNSIISIADIIVIVSFLHYITVTYISVLIITILPLENEDRLKLYP